MMPHNENFMQIAAPCGAVRPFQFWAFFGLASAKFFYPDHRPRWRRPL